MAAKPAIQYATVELIPSFYETLSVIANERIYIEMIDAPEYSKTLEFQTGLIQHDLPVFYVVDTAVSPKVIGWVDVSVPTNPRMSHRGFLGMGLLKEFRGQGLGTELLTRAIEHSRKAGLEKIELSVYT